MYGTEGRLMPFDGAEIKDTAENEGLVCLALTPLHLFVFPDCLLLLALLPLRFTLAARIITNLSECGFICFISSCYAQ
jgi:hypothetical protein